jgi:coenzyme F420-reducing hydrogenase alpha subunit
MPSEYAPGGSKPRMTNAQIRRLQKREEEARKIARIKLEKAKKSDEWKKEQEELNILEKVLEDDKLIVILESRDVSLKHLNKQKKELTFLEKLIAWFKNLFS